MKKCFVMMKVCIIFAAMILFALPAACGEPSPSKRDINMAPSLSSTSYLTFWTNDIQKVDTGVVGVSGDTMTAQPVSTLTLTLTLQRWTGSTWVTVKSWTKSANNVDYITDYHSYSVAKGYYYRCVSKHTAKVGTTTESEVLVSSYVLMD